MTERQEKQNKTTAMLSTLGVQIVLLFLAIFFISWQSPNPPLSALSGSNGIELNFGMDTEGTGAIQPTEPVGTDKPAKEEKTEERKSEETPPEQAEEVKEEVKHEKVSDTKPTEKIVTREDDESTIGVNDKKDPKPVEKPKEKPVEVIKPKEVPRKENPVAVYKPNTTAKTESNKTGGEGREGKSGNQGDDANKTGDKGSPQGTPDAKAMYGNQGTGGNGAGGAGGVSMTGFNGFEWPTVNTPALPDEAYGTYEFSVKIDDNGQVTNVIALKRGLSLEAEQKLKAAIRRLEFVPKSAGLPPQSEGRITFRVVSK